MDIQIRRLEPGDYKAVQRIFAQPGAMRGTLQLPFPSEESWKERLAKPGPDRFDLVAVVDGEVVAMVVLSAGSHRRKHVGTIDIGVHDQWQSRGIGTALLKAATDLADNWLALSRLELTVFTDNEPAVRLYKRFGFEIEGTHRKYAFREGAYVDAHSLARLR